MSSSLERGGGRGPPQLPSAGVSEGATGWAVATDEHEALNPRGQQAKHHHAARIGSEPGGSSEYEAQARGLAPVREGVGAEADEQVERMVAVVR